MTFSQDKNLEQNRSGQSTKETDIFSNNFGGLNTLASPLNIPYEDSPELLNTEVLISGQITKRKGTRVLFKEEGLASTAVGGVSLITYTTALAYNFVVQKSRKDLRLFIIENDVATVRMTKSNVWDSNGGDIRATYVAIPDIEPKLILTTGVNCPVELKFVEKSTTVTSGAPFNSIAFTSDTRYVNATNANVLVFQDRVLKTDVSSVVYGAGTTTVTFTNNIAAGTYTFDIILVVWHWYAEAFLFNGDRFFSSVTELTSQSSGGTGLSNDPDQVITLPAEIRDFIEADLNFNYPIRAYKSTAYNDSFTLKTDREPSTADEYSHSDGTPYKQAAGKKVNPSPLFITFGKEFVPASATDGQSRPVYLSRRRRIFFNGSTDIQGQYLKVFVNSTAKSQNTNAGVGSATYGDWYLRSSDTSTPLTSTSSAGKYLDFEAATVIGIPKDARVEIVNVQVRDIGSAATNVRDDYADGGYIPIYGIGLYSNYLTGSHPRNVSLYQGRLVFSGFPDQPLTVVFSNVFDSVTPGVNYNSFQVDSFSTLDTDPLDIILASQPDDIVKGIIEWQNNLFVLTRKAAFRIFGNQTVLTQRNKFAVFVSNIGLVNSYSLVRTDRSILYLSDIGIFDLTLTSSTNEYEAAEKSIKIRTKFGITLNPAYENLSWMAYDGTNRYVFIGLPVSGTSYTSDVLLVYNTFRESWTEYTTPIGFNAYVALTYVDRANGIGFLMGCCRYRDGSKVPTDFLLIRFGYERYIDFAEHYVGNGSATNYNTSPRSYVTYTTTDTVHEYPVNRSDSGQYRGFDLLPITNLQDCYVTLNGVAQVFSTDWVKLPNGNIYLLLNPGAGKVLNIYMRRPVTEEDIGQVTYGVFSPQNYEHEIVIVDNVLKVLTTDYTVNESSGVYRVNINAVTNSILIIGQAYQILYTSPLLTQKALLKLKRVKHLFAFFDNTLGQRTFNISEVNVTSGQSAEQIVGVPKIRQNVSVAVKYDSDDDAENIYDMYGYSAILWDDAQFDIDPPGYSYRRDGLFKEPLQGLGATYQLLLWNFDETAFIFSGYQLSATLKGSRYIHWTRGG